MPRPPAAALGEEIEQQDPRLEEMAVQADAAGCGLAAVNCDAGRMLDPKRRKLVNMNSSGAAVAAAQRQAAVAGLRAAPALAKAVL